MYIYIYIHRLYKMRVKFVFEKHVIGIRFFERRERKFRGLFHSREKLRNCRGRICVKFTLRKVRKVV